ncbi:MAG: polysaccharide lyase family 7 protein [Cyclobacteriaceae bacterium]
MKILISILALFSLGVSLISCSTDPKNRKSDEVDGSDEAQLKNTLYPSDVLPSLDKWGILLANGESEKNLNDFEHKDYFYTANDGTDWVVFKAPNGGITSPNSHNTRTELGQKARWIPKEGGKLSGSLKVMHVSTSGDARVAASFSVVIGQIHSGDGHENEPLKIFYKKFPGHTKGSVYWNYEINTAGDNSARWDYSTAVWGHDMSVIGTDSASYPAEPEEGIALGEEFSYEVNVYEGMMYLTFQSEGHETRKFTKNLLKSDYVNKSDIPQQIIDLYSVIGRDGTERPNGYEGELQFFKQGAYNQTNGRKPETNMVWSTGSNTYNGDVNLQYANGSYTEVWFRDSSTGPGTPVEE